MARKKSTDERQARSLKARHVPFSGLLLSVPVTLLGWMLLHLAVRGDLVTRVLWTLIVLAAGAGLGALAWGISAGRQTLVRGHVTATVGLSFAAGAATVAIGYPRWWLLTYVVGGIFLAVSWMLYRLDSLRRDKDDGDGEESLIDKLGLGNTRWGRAKRFFDDKGEIARVEIPLVHTRGDTVDVVQGALESLESVANAPRRRSRVVPGETAQNSQLTLIMKDVLKDMVPWPGPSAPGACITAHPIVDGLYEDHQPAGWFLAGNHPLAPNPSSRGIMGMTRTGKTQLAQVDAMEISTRRRVVILWFDSIKGAQTVAPLRPIFDIVVADDVESGNPQMFSAGMRAIKALIKDRANRLGRAGYRSWTPEAADELDMPFVYVHLEEADVLIDMAPTELVFLASKGLSTGVAVGPSLQRADGTSMPTGLRFNIGTWHCFGCGDDYSAGFALSDSTIKAGAHPEEWKQSKPGYFYVEGIGIDQQRWPVTAKGYFATDAQMAAHAAEWGPRMDRLGAEDIRALGEWYQQMKEIMSRDGEASTMTLPSANGNGHRPTRAFVVGGGPSEEEIERAAFRIEAAQEIAEMQGDGSIEPLDPDAQAIDPGEPVPPPREDQGMEWDEPDPVAPDEQTAVKALLRAVRSMATDPPPEMIDPEDPRWVVFMVGDLRSRYPFRSRPWFSKHLSLAADGELEELKDVPLERTGKTGQYRTLRQTERQPA